MRIAKEKNSIAKGLHYVSKPFAMLDPCKYIFYKSDPHERVAAKNVLKFNDLPQSFLFDNHLENKFTNRTFATSISITLKNLSIAKCEEKLYSNLKKGKGSDDSHIGIKLFDYSIV